MILKKETVKYSFQYSPRSQLSAGYSMDWMI